MVTGATRGIGRAIAQALARAGARVTICGRTAETVEQAVAELRAATEGSILGQAADVSNWHDVRSFFDFVERQTGGLDILINNAGLGIFRSVADLEPEEWRRQIDLNLSGVYYCCRQAVPLMRRRSGGYIIQISSLAGKNAFAGGAAYNASKFGVNGFSEAIMQDLRYENIRVSYIMPGSVDTDFSPSTPRTSTQRSTWKIQPEDVAQVVLNLLQMPDRTLVSRVEMRPSRPAK